MSIEMQLETYEECVRLCNSTRELYRASSVSGIRRYICGISLLDFFICDWPMGSTGIDKGS